MESKDPPEHRPSLHLDASKFNIDPHTDDAPSTPSTPPHTRPRAHTQSDPVPPPQVRSRAATIANPPKSAPPGGPPEREKRKRSRVTPEQLAHLERIFAVDKSPTAAKRKEISEMLGMQERQTQIWFQNRRAKAKTLEGKGKIGFRGSPTSGGDSPPDTPPEFSPALDVDLHTLIHEDEPVTFIPCSDLSIGSWRRISATLGQHDLVAYISVVKRCLTWFIHSNGYGFKMEIPFDSIATTTLTAAASPGQALASLYLSRPPLFYLEAMSSPTSGLASAKIWKKCADWTEGQQATKVLRHDLVGATLPLVNALKNLPGSEHLSPSVSTAAPTMHIPQPPMAGLEVPASYLTHGRKRSFSGPPALSHDLQDFLLPGPSDVHASFTPSFPEYPPPLFRSSYPLSEFSTVPISHAIAPRPYSASSVDTRFPFDVQEPYIQATTTPALLTSAFDPATLTSAGSGAHEMQPSQFGGPPDESASHDPPFEATLSIASQHDPPQTAP